MALVLDTSLIGIALGIVAGLVRAGLGWLNRPEGEEIKPRALARTFVTSVLASLAIVTTIELDLSNPLQAFITIMSTMGIDYTVKEAKDAIKEEIKPKA